MVGSHGPLFLTTHGNFLNTNRKGRPSRFLVSPATICGIVRWEVSWQPLHCRGIEDSSWPVRNKGLATQTLCGGTPEATMEGHTNQWRWRKPRGNVSWFDPLTTSKGRYYLSRSCYLMSMNTNEVIRLAYNRLDVCQVEPSKESINMMIYAMQLIVETIYIYK